MSGLPVAERWFRVERLDERVTVVTEPAVHPLLRANIWHVRGADRDLVVDAGLGVASLRTALPWLFARDPVLVVTHAHLDHLGGAHEFGTCLAHPLERVTSPAPGTLRPGPLADVLGLDDPDEVAGWPDPLLGALPAAGYDPDGYALRAPPVALPVLDGDVLDLGDVAFTALHLPGHSPGSLALLDPQDGVLLSGDVVYDLEPGEELLDGLTGSDVADYCASLERLADLPVRTVLPGHGDVIGRTRLLEIVRAHLASRGRR